MTYLASAMLAVALIAAPFGLVLFVAEGLQRAADAHRRGLDRMHGGAR